MEFEKLESERVESEKLDFESSDITRNYFYNGRVIVYQRRKGYRFSVDAPILADFLPFDPGGSALEVGTGSGIVSLLALYCGKFSHITGLEVQDRLGRLALENSDCNGYGEIFRIFHGDFNRTYRHFTGIRHIFSNPPFFSTRSGRLSPNPEIRDAKVETRLTLRQLFAKTHAILGKKGNFYVILPYDRHGELMDLVRGSGYFVARYREVLSFVGGKPERFLLHLVNYEREEEVMGPLVIFREKGVYTEEMERLLSGPLG